MNELIELTDLQAVAKAQADRWEIEFFRYQDGSANGEWAEWKGKVWQEDSFYRARPRQPKMETVKMECWIDDSGELRWVREWWSPKHDWIRVPAEDKTVEVPEELK